MTSSKFSASRITTVAPKTPPAIAPALLRCFGAPFGGPLVAVWEEDDCEMNEMDGIVGIGGEDEAGDDGDEPVSATGRLEVGALKSENVTGGDELVGDDGGFDADALDLEGVPEEL